VGLSGVPASFVNPTEGEEVFFGSIVGKEVFRQSFSGVDYAITAVIPFEHDYQARPDAQVQALRSLLARAEAESPPNQSKINSLRQALEFQDQSKRQTSQPFFKTFGEIQTLTVSSRRSVNPVRRLGEKSPAYYTRGPRTWAGSMVFVMLDGDVMLQLYRRTEADPIDNEPFFAVDRLPPFNILITGINEYGALVEGALLGVTLIATGETFSIDDMYTEQQFTYVARWRIPMARREQKSLVLDTLGRQYPSRGRGAVSDLEAENRAKTEKKFTLANTSQLRSSGTIVGRP
jgi:hypothetical protein